MIDDDFAWEFLEHECEGLKETLLPHIKDWMENNADAVMDLTGREWCESCEDFVKVRVVTISGRVGHIDNWLPDEHEGYCEDCDARMDR